MMQVEIKICLVSLPEEHMEAIFREGLSNRERIEENSEVLCFFLD